MISIAIPTYEMNGKGTEYLARALESINKQIFSQTPLIEIVISDHSNDQDIESFVLNHSSPHLIRYIKNPNSRGNISANTNFAIKHCKLDYIKILFQDDLLVGSNYLKTIFDNILKNSPKFILTGASHTTNGIDFFHEMAPKKNEFILFGENTVSSPSTLTIHKSVFEKIQFDENLKLLMDCDFYHNLFSLFNNHSILPNIFIANGVWTGQTHNNMNGHNVIREVEYLMGKYQGQEIAESLEKYSEFLKAKDYNLAKSLRAIAVNNNPQYGLTKRLLKRMYFKKA
jgi:hypothetical protein